jgi:mono/diheme cytochrome c family protein
MARGFELTARAIPIKYWLFPIIGPKVEEERRVQVYFFRFVLLSALLATGSAFAGDPHLVIRKVLAPATSPVSGSEMFNQYCASCHGADAKGRGPALAALKTPPPDLTQLSRNNQGRYPDARVYSAIRGDANFPAHGSKDMPVWGVIFHEMGGENAEAEVAVRMRNLCLYIQSLQQK